MSSSGGASSPTTPEAPGSSLSNATNSASTTTHAGATSNAQARPPSAPGGGSPPSSPEGKKSPSGRRTRRRRTSPPIKKRLEARKEQKGYRNAEEGKQHIDKKLQAASENRASMRRNIREKARQTYEPLMKSMQRQQGRKSSSKHSRGRRSLSKNHDTNVDMGAYSEPESIEALYPDEASVDEEAAAMAVQAEQCRETALFQEREAQVGASQRRDNAMHKAQDAREEEQKRARSKATSKQVMAERRREHLTQAIPRSQSYPPTEYPNSPDPVLSKEEEEAEDNRNAAKLEARLLAASERRKTWIDSIVRQNKVSDAARKSRVSLANTRAQRDKNSEFQRMKQSQQQAEERRKNRIAEIQSRAANRNERVEDTARQVKAAKQLQGWWRNEQTSEDDDERAMSPTVIADKAMHRVHFSPLRKAVSPEISSSRPKNDQVPAMELNPESREGACADSSSKDASSERHETVEEAASRKAFESMLVGPGTSKKIKCVHKAKRYFIAERSRKSLLTLARLLSGSYTVESSESPAKSDTEELSIKSSPTDFMTAVTQLNTNSSPYGSFEEVASAIQQHDVLSTASFFIRLLLRAYRILNPLIPQYSSEISSADYMQDDSHTYSLSADDALASDGSLRPSIAQSPRTFLASLLIAWYPDDILTSRKEGGGSNTRQRQIERILMHNARVMLNAFEALLWAIYEHSQGSSTPSATPVERYKDSEEGPESVLKARFQSASTLAHVQTLLSCTNLDHTDLQLLPKKTVLLIHRIFAFNATWCEYMDSFMSWKVGDGARMAQALAKPFRDLIVRQEQYSQEVERMEGRDEGAQQLLQGVNSQLRQLNRQLVRLLGQRGAERWQNDQINTMKKLRQIDASEYSNTGKSTPRTASSSAKSSTQTSTIATMGEGSASSTAVDNQESTDESSSVPASAKQSPSMGLIKQVMSNESMVHELLLEEEFQYPEPVCPDDVMFNGNSSNDFFADAQHAVERLQELRSTVTKGETLNLNSKVSREKVAQMLRTAFSDTLGYIDDQSREDASGSSKRYHRPMYWAEQLGLACFRNNEEGISIVLSTIEKVRESLVELVPHRKDLHSHIREKIDLDFYRQLMQAGTFSLDSWGRLLQFCVQLIQQLEAPARKELTDRWLKGAEERLKAYLETPTVRSEGLLLDAPLLDLLPRSIAFLLFKVEEIRVDMANFHLSTLKPFLQSNDKGVDYELKKFKERVENGELNTNGTRTWLHETVRDTVENRKPDSLSVSEASVNLIFDDVVSRLAVIRDGVLLLMTTRLPLNTVAWIASQNSDGIAIAPVGHISSISESSNSVKYFCLEEIEGPDGQKYQKIPFPEIFRMDTRRFTESQNDIQRCILVGVLGALVLEFLRSSQGGEARGSSSTATVKSISDLYDRVNSWLLDDEVRLPDLKAGIAQATADLAHVFGKYSRLKPSSTTNELEDSANEKIGEIVESAISYKHPLFSVYHKRIFELLRYKMTTHIIQLKGSSFPKQRAEQHPFFGVSEPASHIKAALPAPLAEDFDKIAHRLSRISVHAESVFGHSYVHPLLRQCNNRGQAESPQDGAGAAAAGQ
eukprot:gb/GECG01002910.1/.p1 GENE.gb/GECG01002910.1/~~gb/GECG01002910.1/.p1  ORF type:complete len:1569 (+),score=253.68 gb/GECG01002910.1/:1-4707(+)